MRFLIATMRPVNNLRGMNAVKLRVLWVKDLDVRSPKIKAAQQGGFDSNLQTSYGITPAGGCIAGPAIVAAAASFKIR